MRIATKTAAAIGGLALVTGGAVWLHHRETPTLPVPGNFAGLVSGAMDQVAAAQQVEAAADVVVTRRVDGDLVVTGRAVKGSPLVATSIDDLRVLLRGVPGPGMGVVRVEYHPSAGDKDPLFADPPPDVEPARAALERVLAEAGFTPSSRVSTKPVL